MSEPWLSADYITAHLGLTKDIVYVCISEKDIPIRKIGRRLSRSFLAPITPSTEKI